MAKHVRFEDFSIVYFGTDWNAENKTSSHHIAFQLARSNKLLYIDSPGLRSPKLSSRDLSKTFAKLRGALRPPSVVGENIWYVVVPQLPFRRIRFIKAFNRFVGSFLINRALRIFGSDKRIVWFATPDLASLAHRLNGLIVIYYCTDKHEALPDIDSEEVARLDQELTKKADLIVCSAEVVCIDKKKINPNCIYSPHGVDFKLFEHARDPSLPIPHIARHLKPPVIGYFGSVAAWLDLELIRAIAQSRSDWTLLLVGHSSVDTSRLSHYSNIVFVGPQPYQTLPSWVKMFDVAIYPARTDHDFVKHANPLKIREYLAAGKPVVSVSTHEIRKLSPPVRIADTVDEFIEELDKALIDNASTLNRSRDDELRQTSWTFRVAQIKKTMEKTLSKSK